MAPINLQNLRLGFACKQRWDDMVGDDHVRLCGACDRQVFNLSEMTREEAEAVLATRGLTPCVRFYRRPDGTVMTSDCPSGARPAPRRLAVLAAGTALAAAPAVMADPPAEAPPEATDDGSAGSGSATPAQEPILLDHDYEQGIPVDDRFEMGIIIATEEKRPLVEWSVWGRLGVGIASPHSDVLARRITPPAMGPESTWDAAAAADLTFRVARDGDLRLGAWGELRTTSDPVAGAELVLEGLPPHPYDSHINGTGSLVLRAGGNARVITGAIGFGYVGSYPHYDPWIKWARHVVGARLVVSMDRSRDRPRDWSATVGLEVEPIGAAHALYDLIVGR